MFLSTIRLHWVRVPLHEAFRISSGEVSIKEAILIELTADGKTGWGEASPMPGAFYSAETPEGTWDFLRRRLVPWFLENPQFDPRSVSQHLDEFLREPFAKAGLEGAVWHLAAQRESKPLWALLGSKRRPIQSGAAIGLMPTLPQLPVAPYLGAGAGRSRHSGRDARATTDEHRFHFLCGAPNDKEGGNALAQHDQG